MRQLKDLGLIIAYELHGFRYLDFYGEGQEQIENLAILFGKLYKEEKEKSKSTKSKNNHDFAFHYKET